MAENTPPIGSIQSPDDVDVKHHNSLPLLGQDLDDLLKSAKGEIDDIILEVDTKEHSAESYNCFVTQLLVSRTAIQELKHKWEKMSGAELQDTVRMRIAEIVYASVKLVTDIKGKLEKLSDLKTPIIGEINRDRETRSATRDVQLDNRTAYGVGLSTAASLKTTSRSKAKSSRHSSASSTAMKLKLKTEEVELEINQRYSRELTDRAKRKLSRDARKERPIS